MTKETYRELEALAVLAVKDGLTLSNKDSVALGLQALATLHQIRYPAGAGFSLLPGDEME